MLRYTILDIIINDNDNISQETFECFTEAIEENPKIILKVKIMKTRKHFIRKYELLVRCVQTNLEFFIA